MAVANAMLQRNAPLPPCAVRCRTCVRQQLGRRFAWYRQCTIARQPVRPVFIACFQSLFNQQSSKARTVDKQITFNSLATLQNDSIHVTIDRALRHLNNLAFCSDHTARLTQFAQIFGVQIGVKMIGVCNFAQGRVGHRQIGPHEFVGPRCSARDGVAAQICSFASSAHFVPILLERYGPQVLTNGAKTMHVTVTHLPPIHKLNGQFVGAISGF